MPKTVTFDSTSKPNDEIVLSAISAGWHVAYASVTLREAKGADFEIQLKTHDLVAEIGVWDESNWGEARWADVPSSERLEQILSIVANGSFPKQRNSLSQGQLHQLRDAMILETHAAEFRSVFVTGDAKAFITGGRREKLQSLLDTVILTPDEFQATLKSDSAAG